MNKDLIFWAQALDNSSPDHIEISGAILSPDDTVRRQEAVSRVSNVVKAGTRVFESRDLQMTADEHHFVIEVPSTQRDRAGRTAPVVCYGDYGSTVNDELAKSVAVGFDEFAKGIGRSLQPAQSEFVRAFEALKKNVTTRKLVRGAGIAAAVLVLLLLAYCLESKGTNGR